jgi:hypothetical protein
MHVHPPPPLRTHLLNAAVSWVADGSPLELHGHPAHRERPLQRREQAPGGLGGGRPVGQTAQEHGELVASEPRERVAAAQRVAEAVGDIAQQQVAVVVAERVVDLGRSPRRGSRRAP